MSRPRLVAVVVLLSAIGYSQERTPDIDGYVTAVKSATEFSVDGIPVRCNEKTDFGYSFDPRGGKGDGPYIGQPLKVYGWNKKNVLEATAIFTQKGLVVRRDGYGVIDKVLYTDTVSPAQAQKLIVRADGLPVQIDKSTRSNFHPPLQSLGDVTTNVWVEFRGEQRRNGLIVATEATFKKNEIGDRESGLRKKADYDPSKVDPKDKQGGLSKAFLGVKAKRIPPAKDPASQARVERIGQNLVPAYQRVLPDSDPTKIHFRFQVVDVDWRQTWDLPSGVILVPDQVVTRLPQDPQLAEVLAFAIATALEKRAYRDQYANEALNAASWGGAGAGFLVPGLGPAELVGGVVVRSAMRRNEEEQSARVSLGLMDDAHYDVYQAPLAWWALASKKPKKPDEISIPSLARYFYKTLGETWQNGQMAREPAKNP